MDEKALREVEIKQELTPENFKVEKKRRTIDRFNGTPKEELMKRSLPDHIKPGLDILIIGINPSLIAAYKQHYYASAGNHFWKCLFLSGLIPEPMTADDDKKLLDHGIGFTDIVKRTTPCSSDLSRSEIREGAQVLLSKIQQFQPRIAVFNGKGIYEIFNNCFGQSKKHFDVGKQPYCIPNTNTHIFVMPSSSARCAQLPRAVDKVPIYTALKKFRDHLKGYLPELKDSELVFPDLDLIAAPVEPEARAKFIEDKRAKDEARKAERARIKQEKIERGELPKPRAPKRKIPDPATTTSMDDVKVALTSTALTATSALTRPATGTFRELSLALPCEEKQGYDVQKWVDSHNFGIDPDDDEEDFHLENGVHIEFKYDLKSNGSSATENSDSSHSTKTLKPTTISTGSSGYVSFLAENKGSPDDVNARLGAAAAAVANSKTLFSSRTLPGTPQQQSKGSTSLQPSGPQTIVSMTAHGLVTNPPIVRHGQHHLHAHSQHHNLHHHHHHHHPGQSLDGLVKRETLQFVGGATPTSIIANNFLASNLAPVVSAPFVTMGAPTTTPHRAGEPVILETLISSPIKQEDPPPMAPMAPVAQLSLLQSPIRVDPGSNQTTIPGTHPVTYPLYLLPGQYASLNAEMMVARQHGHQIQLASSHSQK